MHYDALHRTRYIYIPIYMLLLAQVELGRTDQGPEGCPANGRLPDAAQGAQHLRDVFYRQGFDDREIVALSGAHTLGRCHVNRSGFDGPWTSDPLKFDNEYFVNLLDKTWKKREWDGPEQFEDEETGSLMMLPTDIALTTDDAFRPVVEEYAKDEDLFKRDFAAACAKLFGNGCAKGALADGRSDATKGFAFNAMHGSLIACKKHAADGADAAAREPGTLRTPLHKAAFWGHGDIVANLIDEHGVAVNEQDAEGDTPLNDAVRFGHGGVVKMLLDAGADHQLANKLGQNAMKVAEAYEQGAIAEQLKAAGVPE